MNNFQNMTEDECNALCESFFSTDDTDKIVQRANYCQDCCLDMEAGIDGYFSCMDCGQCGSSEVYIASPSYELNSTLYNKKSIYKRRLYCREKLKLLCGRKKCFDQEYIKLVERLKKKKIKNIIQLKQFLKDWGKRRYYKHIYNMFYDITGKRLIDLTCLEIQRLSYQFVKIEIKFKRNSGRKNIFNYNSIIYALMKKNKIKGYSHIVLPLNHLQISKSIKKFIK